MDNIVKKFTNNVRLPMKHCEKNHNEKIFMKKNMKTTKTFS